MSHFNQAANSWDTPEKKEQNRKYAEEIKTLAGRKEFKNILEVGCGTGLLGENFLSNTAHLLGIDTSEGMLAVFAQKFSDNPYVRALKLNLEKELLNEESFDLILSSMAFHHLQSPSEMMKKLAAKLSPGGIAAIIDLDQEDGSFHPDPAGMGVHHFGFNEETTQSWAKENGLKMERKIINIIQKNEKQYPVFLAVFYDNRK